MPRFRNPRFAPEFLERKLSPSSITGVAVKTAEYSTMQTSIDKPPVLPGSEPGDPPLPPPPSDVPGQP